jgi:hypothetical protein
MFTLKADFIADFKLGDNINYNLKILEILYETYNGTDPAKNTYLVKPIVLTILSIIEAVLYDFHYRAKWYTREGVSNLSNDIIEVLRQKKIDDFGKYIASAKKSHLFDSVQENFYEDLERLRIMRNRIHIQNDKKYMPKDESAVFNQNSKYLAECALEIVLRTMDKKFKRPESVRAHVKDFVIPWEPKYGDLSN